MRANIPAEEATRMLAFSLEDCVRRGLSIERSLEVTSQNYGIPQQTVSRLLLSKLIGMSIHEKMSSGLGVEDSVSASLRRFNTEPSPEQKLALIRSIHAEQERINTRLKDSEMDDGMGGTVVIDDGYGNEISKKELRKNN